MCRLIRGPEENLPLFEASGDGFRRELPAHLGLHANGVYLWPSDLAAQGPVVVLGEPGVGKTTMLRQIVGDAEVEWVDGLVSTGPELADLLISSCDASDGHTFVVVDQLDECPDLWRLARVLRPLLAEHEFSSVRLLIGCRATDWRSDLQLLLREQFGGCTLVEVAPLSRSEAVGLVNDADVDGEALVSRAVELGAGFLASVPLTLEMLVLLWRRNGELVGNSRELFQQAVEVLVEEPDPDRTNRTGSRTGRQLVGVAARLASYLLLTGKRSLWLGRQLEARPEDLRTDLFAGGRQQSDMGSFEITQDTLKELLNTAMFVQLSTDRVAFRHSSLAAYLAARFLIDSNVPAEQLRNLFLTSAADGTHGIPISLRETAAWLVSLDSQHCSWLAEVDAESITSHSRLVDSPAIRKTLVEVLLRRALEVELGDHWWMSGDWELDHADIATQLVPVLEAAVDAGPGDWSTDAKTRMALRIANESRSSNLLESLRSFVGDARWRPELRASAIRATVSIDPFGAVDICTKVLEELSQPEAPEDINDDLRAAALDALYPRHMSALEVLPYLTPRRQNNYLGSYWTFLTGFVSKGSEQDVADILAWAIEDPVDNRDHDDPDLRSMDTVGHLERDGSYVARLPIEVAESLPERILGSANAPEMLDQLATLLLGCFDTNERPNLPSCLDPSSESSQEVFDATLLRRGLARALCKQADNRYDIWQISYRWKSSRSRVVGGPASELPVRNRLVDSDDFQWAAEECETAQSARDLELAESLAMLAGQLFDPSRPDLVDLLCNRQGGLVWDELSHLFDAIDIESDVADRAREALSLDREAHRPDETDTFVSDLKHCVAQLATFDTDAYWRLLWNLQLDPETGSGRTFAHETFEDFPGFGYLAESEQETVRSCAALYLETESDNRESWLGTKIYDKRAAAGYWALAYASAHSAENVAGLSGLIERWVGAVVWYPTRGEDATELRSKKRLLSLASDLCSETLVEVLSTHIWGELERGYTVLVLDDLDLPRSGVVVDGVSALLVEVAEAASRHLPEPPIDGTDLESGASSVGTRGDGSLEILAGSVGLENALSFITKAYSRLWALEPESVRRMIYSILDETRDGDGWHALQAMASATLMNLDLDGEWASVRDRLSRDADLSKAVAYRYASYSSGERRSEVLAETLVDIYRWVTELFPSDDDTIVSGWVSPEERVRSLRRGLLAQLAERAEDDDLSVLTGLVSEFPNSVEVRASLVHARSKAQADSWHPSTTSELSRMFADGSRRLVRNERELAVVVCATLREIETHLDAHGEFLWDRRNSDGTDLWRPKYESSLCAYFASQLELRIGSAGVIVNREVLVKPTNARGAGERTDIHVQAISWGDSTPLTHTITVVVEVKGQWNGELVDSLQSQLVYRYLAHVESREGLYVVGWYLDDDWNDGSDSRRSTALKRDKTATLEKLQAEADIAYSNCGRKVRPMIIQIPRPRPVATS